MKTPSRRTHRSSLLSSVRRPRDFTLIELLVVITIIMILASLLVPVLDKAYQRAKALQCQLGRRTNYMSLSMFVSDHDGLVPHPVGAFFWGGPDGTKPTSYYRWEGYNAYASEDQPGAMVPYHKIQWGPGPNGIYFDNGGTDPDHLSAIGVLVAFGYIAAPELLYCPDYIRPERNKETYRVDEYPEYWEALRDDDGVCPNWNNWGDGEDGKNVGPSVYPAQRSFAGIVTYFRDDHDYSRLQDYTEMWPDNNKVSPMMFSCAQTSRGDSEKSKVWGFLELAEDGYSHGARGLNGVFVDGSARWISEEEVSSSYGAVGETKYADWLTNGGYRGASIGNGNFQYWVRSSKFSGIALSK